MVSASVVILEYVCPTLGCIMGNIMFAAPYQSVKTAVKEGRLGELNTTPWAFMTGNCLGWVTYSFLLQNLFIFFANAPGFIFSVWLNMCAVKLQYAQHCTREMRQSFVQFLESNTDDDNKSNNNNWRSKAVDWGKILVEVSTQQTPAPAAHEHLVVGIVFAWMVVIAILSFGTSFSSDTRQFIVGIVVNVNLCFFYGAPLSTIWTVLTTRSSASIHAWTMGTNTLNSSFWTAYGIAVKDPFIWVPNGLGAVLGIFQFILCILFPRNLSAKEQQDDDDGDEPAPMVELESAHAKQHDELLLEEGLSTSRESNESPIDEGRLIASHEENRVLIHDTDKTPPYDGSE